MTRVVLYLVTTLREENSPPTSQINVFPAFPLCTVPCAMIIIFISFPYKIEHEICFERKRYLFIPYSQFNVDLLKEQVLINVPCLYHLLVLVQAADFS
jgi:hypothetical protein